MLKEFPEFGYKSAAAEKEWYDSHQDLIAKNDKRAAKAKYVRTWRERKKLKEEAESKQDKEKQFLEAIRDLPPTAPMVKEFDWLRSHPAMIRLATQSATSTARIEITAEDITNPPNGRPPSQAAAIQLVNAANAPGNMVKAVFSKMIKAVEDGGGRGGDAGPDAPTEWDGVDDEQIKELESYCKRTKESIDSAKS